MFDKKKTLAAIIATGKPKAPEKKEVVAAEEDEELEEMPEEETPIDLEAAAEDVMDALSGGSAKKFASALKAFMALC